MRRDLVITLPMTERWEDYQKELDAVANWEGELLFKVPNLPPLASVGMRCYLVYQGHVRGWMAITGLRGIKHRHAFTCETTGREWQGKFIVRSGPFQPIDPLPLRGFRGWRYWNHALLNAPALSS